MVPRTNEKTVILSSGLKAGLLGGLTISVVLLFSKFVAFTSFGDFFTIIVNPLISFIVYVVSGALAADWVLPVSEDSRVYRNTIFAGAVAVLLTNFIGNFVEIFLAFLPALSIPHFTPSFHYSPTTSALQMVIALVYGTLSANIWATLKTNSGFLTATNSNTDNDQTTLDQGNSLFAQKVRRFIENAAWAFLSAIVAIIPAVIIFLLLSIIFGAIYGFASFLPSVFRDVQELNWLWSEVEGGAIAGLIEGILPGILTGGMTCFTLAFGYFLLKRITNRKRVLLILACLSIGFTFLTTVQTYAQQNDIQMIKTRYIEFQRAYNVGLYETAYNYMSPVYQKDHTLENFSYSLDCSPEELDPMNSISISGNKATVWPSNSNFMQVLYAGSTLEFERIDGVWYFTGECNRYYD